jgi:hypothetical protein
VNRELRRENEESRINKKGEGQKRWWINTKEE